MEELIQKIEAELKLLQERNSRVEGAKDWETSVFRVFSIAVITYVVATLVMYLLGTDKFYLGSLIPVVGYLLSTQSLPLIKKRWLENRTIKINR